MVEYVVQEHHLTERRKSLKDDVFSGLRLASRFGWICEHSSFLKAKQLCI